MPGALPYKTYSEFLAERFPWKMQKISVNIGNTCPNRDGRIGQGGCIYCNNDSFVPSYCHKPSDIISQIEEGKAFFSRKYPDMRYLVYFQAYTSTYTSQRNELLKTFEKAINQTDVEGIVVSTRPDCIDKELLQYLKLINGQGKRVMLEIGVETTHDKTLKFINRNHNRDCALGTIRNCREEGFDVGVHLIMGLPGENKSMMLDSVKEVCSQGATSLKLHQLQIVRYTPLYYMWQKKKELVHLFSLEEYLNLCVEIVRMVPRNIAIERFTSSSPSHLLVAPSWGVKNYQFVNLLNNRLTQ